MHRSELVALRTGYLMGFADALGQRGEPPAPGLRAANSGWATAAAERRNNVLERAFARAVVALQRCGRCWEDLGASARPAPGCLHADAPAEQAGAGGCPPLCAGDARNGSAAVVGPTVGPHGTHGLTRREVEVLGLLAAGLSHREIATALVVSVRTVGRHIDNLYGKIGARGRSAARQYARAHGLVARLPPSGR
jgi:DNA-binding CsgD family transcriptional regulator